MSEVITIDERKLIDRLINEVGIKLINIENKSVTELLEIAFFAVGVKFNRSFNDERKLFEVSDSETEAIIEVYNEWCDYYFEYLTEYLIKRYIVDSTKPVYCIPVCNPEWFAKWGDKISVKAKAFFDKYDPENWTERYVECSGGAFSLPDESDFDGLWD